MVGTGSVLTTIGAVLRAPASPRAELLEIVGACDPAGLDGVSV
jgi:hypothetical protein